MSEPKATKAVVYSLARTSRCHSCDQKLNINEIVRLQTTPDETEALCQSCAKLTGFTLVEKGNPKVTKLATKYSSTTYVVLKWSHLWKCYERIGIFAEQAAVAKAKEETQAP